MKLAYIYLDFMGPVGPEKKLQERASIAKNHNVNMDFFIFNQYKDGRIGNINYVKINSKIPFLLNCIMLFKKYSVVDRKIDLAKYDCVILRYWFADKSGVSFTKKYKVITEHHTHTYNETLEGIKSAHSLFVQIVRLVKLFLEKQYAVPMLANCIGIVARTDEIRYGISSLLKNGVPSITISNGANVDEIKKTGFSPFDGKTLNMVLAVSSVYPWVGLERLLVSLNAYCGDVKIVLHLVGSFNKKKILKLKGAKKFIRFYGIMSHADLDDIMEKMNLAVGSLALYKNRMSEACTLKVRGYLARGIPFILAYKDTDLQNIAEGQKYWLVFRNDDTPLDIEEILKFAQSVSKYPKRISEEMREYARKNVGLDSKFGQLLNFIEKCVQND